MKKRIISLLLCLVTVLLLMSTAAFAADTEYGLWVNGEQFTSEKTTIACGSGTATYDPDKDELTLNNATITKVYRDGEHPAAVYSEKDLKVILKGTNTVSLDSVIGYGFHTYNGSLTLTGDGSLGIKIENSTSGPQAA